MKKSSRLVSVQERRRQEYESSAQEAIWEKAVRYWAEHVSTYA